MYKCMHRIVIVIIIINIIYYVENSRDEKRWNKRLPSQLYIIIIYVVLWDGTFGHFHPSHANTQTDTYEYIHWV